MDNSQQYIAGLHTRFFSKGGGLSVTLYMYRCHAYTSKYLRSRISDINLARLMQITIKGPELTSVDFNEILEVFKEKNHRIML